MKTATLRAAALCVAMVLAPQPRAAELPLPRDGWASWQVDAVEDAPAFCCWSSWQNGASDTKACDLDGGRQNMGSRDKETTDSVRVYARFSAGKVERVRALAASCPVESKTPVQKLDNVSTDDSARWLTGLLKQERSHELLGALAMHRGPLALEALSSMARADADADSRKQAMFWLAIMRGQAGADVVSTLMFADKDSEVRKHAIFATTQSKSPHISADLIRLGNTDPDADVRAQAWFWYAQTAVPNAEAAIFTAVKKDGDDQVREQAVFALSRLPDERATKALIAVAEDRTLSHEQRKRALFWLGQSESAGAQKYLDAVLTGNTNR